MAAVATEQLLTRTSVQPPHPIHRTYRRPKSLWHQLLHFLWVQRVRFEMELAINMVERWEKALIYLCILCLGYFCCRSSVRVACWAYEQYASPVLASIGLIVNGR